ncbi:FadR/GntR family transcriptional regulator [Ramlibacter sp. PS4R-6]|uniref:FadR/GntR family transcriptional regulator n=1 Tax=Ramlibacter sp. PS4R-6 TaxID=3133438 RepID=UPI0030A3A6B6
MSTAKASVNPEPAPVEPGPRRRLRNLASELVDGIGARIRDRKLKPGDKLPTEAEIMREWGVSRTVVREALSKLQASSLVETRHGVGTFVLEPPAPSGFRIDPAEIATAVDVLAVLELRISLETESAGLAAARRTEEQLNEMRRALDELAAGDTGSKDTVGPDFRFHHLIAVATGNRYFADIMSHLGATLIPRARINSSKIAREDWSQYHRRLSREHEEIYDAIARRDPEAARAAMRLHLTNSRERLRRAQEAAGTPLAG